MFYQKIFSAKFRQIVLFTGAVISFMGTTFAQLDVEHYIPPLHARTLPGSHYLVLGTPVGASFNVTVKDGAGNFIATIPISGAASVTTFLGSNYTSPFMVDYNNLNTIQSSGKGLILTAPQPFYANIRAKVTNQAGSLTSKGTAAAKGKDFWTGHMYSNSASGTTKSSCFSFMATENNTTVVVSNIHAGVVLEGVAAGTTTFTRVLNAGESYVVSNYMDNPLAINNANGLNGTHITSDKDIVVNCATWMGGNSTSGTTNSGTALTGKDLGMDQIVPLKNVGTEYVMIKGFGVDNERTVIVATQNNTQLFLNGGTPLATINAGNYYVLSGTYFSSNDNVYLKASAPVFVTQTINGLSGYSSDNEHCGGMNFIPPVVCTGDKKVTVPNVHFIGSAYIQIIADAGAVIQANGSTIGGAKTIPGTSDYVTYSLSGYTGDVQLVSTLPIRVALINGSGNIGAAGYFSGFSKELNIEGAYENGGVTGDEEIMEGCGTASITIKRLEYYAANAATIDIQVSGTAINGVDYSNVPNQITMAAGQTQSSFTIDAFADGVYEGTETVTLSLFLNGNMCGVTDLTFKIKNINDLNIQLDSLIPICLGDSLVIAPVVTGGLQPYTYLWSTGDTTNQIVVEPSFTTDYNVVVTDLCAVDSVFAETTLDVPTIPLTIFGGLDTTVLCPYTPINFSAEANGGSEAYAFQWLSNGITLSFEDAYIYAPPITAEYIVTVTDNCGLTAQDTVSVVVTTPLMNITVSDKQIICPNDEVEIWGNVTGGLPPFSYVWDHSGETTTNVLVHPAFTTTYSIRVTDACETYAVVGHPIVEVVKPTADFNVLSNTVVENLPISFANTTVGGVYWDWDMGNGTYSDLFAPNATYPEDGTYWVTLIATNEIGCTDTVSKQISIKPEFWFYAPNAFTPDGNQFNNNYAVSVIGSIEFQFNIYNRWGELVFQAMDPDFEWDGTYNGVVIQDGVYVYTAVVVGEDNETRTFTGHINLLR